MSASRRILSNIGSLWLAAMLLVWLLVAMAYATVFESMAGTKQALAEFYGSWWFEAALGMLGINVLAALLVRYPFTKRQVGFVLAHGGILVILLGAMVTQRWATDGRIGIAEGQTVEHLTTGQPTFAVVDQSDDSRSSLDLARRDFTSVKSLTFADAPQLRLDDLQVDVQEYLPDGMWVQEVTNNSPYARPAVQVALSSHGNSEPVWLFTGKAEKVAGQSATYVVAADEAELQSLLAPQADSRAASPGEIHVEFQGTHFEYSLSECTEQAVPLGKTGFTLQVLRYLPHASVGGDSEVISLSDRPVNPAVEVELADASSSEKRLAFSRFPDFGSLHGETKTKDIKLTFISESAEAPRSPIVVVGGPDGKLFVRFAGPGNSQVVEELTQAQSVNSPWPEQSFVVLQRLDNAKMDWKIQSVEPVRKEAQPAIRLKLTSSQDTSTVWLQKYRPRAVTVEGKSYELQFADKQLPLGFGITLNKFRVGYHPGTNRPRSFESRVTLVDPSTGRTLDRVVSMNNPTKYGGYTFYQSSYSMDRGTTVSFLSVAKDPGLVVVFAGYVIVMVGMLIVLLTRVTDHRRAQELTAGETVQMGTCAGSHAQRPMRGDVPQQASASGVKHYRRNDQTMAAQGAKSNSR